MLPRLYSHNYIEHPEKLCNSRRTGFCDVVVRNVWFCINFRKQILLYCISDKSLWLCVIRCSCQDQKWSIILIYFKIASKYLNLSVLGALVSIPVPVMIEARKFMRSFCIWTEYSVDPVELFPVGNDPRQIVPHLPISVYIHQSLTLFCRSTKLQLLLAKVRAYITYMF